MKDEKKKKFIQVFALALIMLLIASSTYAYFAAQYGDAGSTDIIVNTSTVDSLTFETGDAISISATQSNFGSGAGNQRDDTYASATLVANNDTNEASAYYSIYLSIPTNEFEYTTSEEYAELLLIVTDEDGNLVTSIDGLNYTSVTDGEGNTLSGFDITGYTGSIAITEKHEIISYGIETDKWTVEVVFVNLSTDQSVNAGKELSAKLTIMQSGNTLQAYESDSKIWSSSYRSGITKIVFDDSGATISDYVEVYDISEDQDNSIQAYLVENYDSYCIYDGNEVYGWSGDVTESSCTNVYEVGSTYTGYWDSTIGDNFTSPLSVSWDSNEEVCVIDDLNSGTYYLYTWYYYNTPTEEQCTGYAYSYQDSEYYYLGIEYVGSGEYNDSVCTYNGNTVYNFENWDTSSVTETSCGTIYKITDSYSVSEYYDSTILDDYYNTVSISWNSEEDVCETSTGSYDVYDYWYGYSISQSQCTGIAYEYQDSGYYYIGIESLGSGEWEEDYTQPNGTYIVYIESNAPILANEDMSYWFYSFEALQIIEGLDKLNTSNTTDMRWMFGECPGLTSLDLSSWDTSNVTDMSYMFMARVTVSHLKELNIGIWDVSNVTTMEAMFYSCRNLMSLDLSNWDTSSVTTMQSMFYGCESLTELDLSMFNTSNVTTMSSMFGCCYNLVSLDLSNWETSNVTTMHAMFQYCRSLTSLDLSMFDTSNVTILTEMFEGDSSLKSLNLSNFDTSNVIYMYDMFYNCTSLTSLNLDGWNTSNVTDMSGVFYNCTSLTLLDLSSFDTSNVKYVGGTSSTDGMFANCTSLVSLNLSNASFTNLTSSSYYNYMFYNNNSSIVVTVKDSTAQAFIQERLNKYNGGTVLIA